MGLWKDVRREDIPEDEPVFLIRGQDCVGAATVRCWCELANVVGVDLRMIDIARRQADKMEGWDTKKVPDKVRQVRCRGCGWEGPEPKDESGGTEPIECAVCGQCKLEDID